MKNEISGDISRILIDEDELKKIVDSLAERIARDYAGKKPVIMCVLRGSLIFTADLIRKLPLDCTVEFVTCSSYNSGTETNGHVEVNFSTKADYTGKDIIVLEDILDTGYTLSKLVELLRTFNPTSVEICTLLSKEERREIFVDAKYIGAYIDNQFVVGYGLDYNQKYRNLPYVGVLKDEMIGV